MKFLISLLLLVVALIPTELCLLGKYVLEPQGFWENFLLFGAGIWLLGTAQLLLIVIWFSVVISFIFD
jgi:hypothetical protein